MLDAVKPSWGDSVSIETNAFHEAFGDMTAMLMSLQNDEVLDRLIYRTGGDLKGGYRSKPNLVSQMGEELGNGRGIRSAYNDFHYTDPLKLPKIGGPGRLGREPHDFSRLWTGAFYELLDGIADSYRQQGLTPKRALKAAAEEGLTLLIGQLEKAPDWGPTYRELALALLAGDAAYNQSKRSELIRKVFQRRGILKQDDDINTAYILLNTQPQSARFTLDGGSWGDLAGVEVETLHPEASTSGPNNAQTIQHLKKELKVLQEDGRILVTPPGEQATTEQLLSLPDGSQYIAYVSWDRQGRGSLHRNPYFID